MEPVYPTPSASSTAAPDPGPGSAFTVLFAPVKTFLGLAGRPRFVLAMLALMVAASVSGVVVATKIDPAESQAQMREQFEKQGLAGQELDKAMERYASMSGAAVVPVVVAFTVLTIAIIVLLMAGLSLGGLKLAGASELSFKQALSLTAHSSMPAVIQQVLILFVALGRDTVGIAEAQGGSLLMSNLGFLASEESSAVVRALLGSIDVFSLWTVALATLGGAVLGRVSRSAALTVAGVLWLLGVLLRVGMAILWG
ncbi:MAG: YIP1 family protein [Thermoanaerobaculia bacterium]|nr:YIP1 family protein [Thermoanaerobaculia bacterium]